MSVSFTDPIEKEVWSTLRAMNDTWTKGRPEELQHYFHRNIVAFAATEHSRLDGASACLASWIEFATKVNIHRWEEKDPVIHVYGDSAVVAYYFDMSFDVSGKMTNIGGRDTFFFVRENGKWLAVADHFSPYPA
ncbi:MAG: DUF4440 domain-containing protein [Deltaproteobacteria bacterium]|nr:DUF4440 domain-containing protein [Deltaproteobacteria bacterium]